MEARPGPATLAGAVETCLSGCSIVANVVANGFAGARLGTRTSSSSDVLELVLSNGSSSSSREIDIEGLVKSPSVMGKVESGAERVDMDGEAGGGDCTRTFFAIFFPGRFVVSARASTGC